MPVGRRSQPYVGARTHTHTGYEFTSTSSAVATHEQRNCRSSGKVLNLKIVLDWCSGAISPMAKCWTTKAGHARCGRRLATVSGFSEGVAPEAHDKGFVRIRRFSQGTTAGQRRSRTRCWRARCNVVAQINMRQYLRSDARMTAHDAATR